jgi:hypothetical protein
VDKRHKRHKRLLALLSVLALAGLAIPIDAQGASSTPPPPAKTNQGVKPPDKPQTVTPATTTAQSSATPQTKNQPVGRRPRPMPSAHDGHSTLAVKNQNVNQVRNQAGTQNKFAKSTAEIGAAGTKSAAKPNQANSNNGKPPVVVGFVDGAPDKPSNVKSAAAQTHALPSPTPTPRKRGSQPLKK